MYNGRNPKLFQFVSITQPILTMAPLSLKILFRQFVLIALLVLSVTSCNQYDYSSPNPGILEIRLKTKNSRTSFMPFSSANFFSFNLKSLDAIRSNGARLDVLPDLNAIRRSNDGDNFNTLDTLSRDSVLVLGKVYAPPGTYVGIDIVAQILGGNSFVQIAGVLGIPIIIPVIEPIPPPPALNQLPRPGQTLSFTVNESKLTRVTVMIDLDESLIRHTEFFEGDLQFYVSSIQNF